MRIGRRDGLGAGKQGKSIGRKLLVQILVQAGALTLAVIAGHAHRGRQQETVVAKLVDMPRQRRQEAHGAQRGDGIATHGGTDEGVHRRMFRRRKHFGGFTNVLRRNPSDLGNFFRRIGCDPRLHLVEADRPIRNEIFIIPTVGDDDVDQAESQCAVGAGPDAQPKIGFHGQPHRARVDDDGAGAFFLCVLDAFVLGGVGLGQVHAPQHDDVAV